MPGNEVKVSIFADTRQAIANVDKANKSFTDLAKPILQVGLAVAAMGTAVAAGVFKLVKSFADAGDEIQKMSIRTGFSTEALSELRFAAERSGFQFGEFNAAIRRVQRTIVEASEGSKSYVDSLNRVGLSYSDLQRLSPEQQFNRVAEAIAEIEDPAQRTTAAFDLFGDSGVRLLPFLEDGAEGMRELRQEARDLGLVFDQEAADKAAKFNDKLTDLKGAVQGITFEIGEELVPVLTDAAAGFTNVVLSMKDFRREMKDAREEFADIPGGNLFGPGAGLRDLKQFNKEVDGISENTELMGNTWIRILKDMEPLISAINLDLGNWVRGLDDVEIATDRIGDAFRQAGEDYQEHMAGLVLSRGFGLPVIVEEAEKVAKSLQEILGDMFFPDVDLPTISSRNLVHDLSTPEGRASNVIAQVQANKRIADANDRADQAQKDADDRQREDERRAEERQADWLIRNDQKIALQIARNEQDNLLDSMQRHKDFLEDKQRIKDEAAEAETRAALEAERQRFEALQRLGDILRNTSQPVGSGARNTRFSFEAEGGTVVTQEERGRRRNDRDDINDRGDLDRGTRVSVAVNIDGTSVDSAQGRAVIEDGL